MGPSLWSFPGSVAISGNLSPSTMQSAICTSSGQVISQQSGLTHLCHLKHNPIHPHLSNLSVSDRVDYEVADNISQFDDDTQSLWPETEIFRNLLMIHKAHNQSATAWLHVICPELGNTPIIQSLATSLRSLVTIVPYLMVILLCNIDIQVCNRIYWYTFIQHHTQVYAFTQLSLLLFQIQFVYGILWITPCQPVTICMTYHTNLESQIAEAMCHQKSIEFSLMVSEMIPCGFLRSISQRGAMTPNKAKSSRIESDRLQKHVGLCSRPDWCLQ